MTISKNNSSFKVAVAENGRIIGKLLCRRHRCLSCVKTALVPFIMAIVLLYLLLTAVAQHHEQFSYRLQPLSSSFRLIMEARSPSSLHDDSGDGECNEKDAEICIFKRQILSTEDRNLMNMALKHCSKALDQLEGTSYFLYGTSLVGYYRHNASMIPWEDFVNIALFPTDPKFETALTVREFHRLTKTLLAGNYSMRYDRTKHLIKCYGILPTNSKRIVTNNTEVFWRWPYVEIQLMNVVFNNVDDEDATIVNITDPVWSDFSYEADLILPVRRVHFEGVPVNVPKKVLATLERNYNPYTCRSVYYSHREELQLDDKMAVAKSCSELRHFVAFTNLDFADEANETTGLPTCEIGRLKDDPLLCTFLPVLTSDEKNLVLKLMSITIAMLEQLDDARYFLYGGTLIGYWRHNGSMIPWDDDVDIAVFRTNPDRDEQFYVNQFKKLAKNYPGYGVHYISEHKKLKTFGTTSTNSRKIGRGNEYEWRWPFVDIQLMDTEFVNGTDTIAKIADPSGFSAFWYPGEMIMPLELTTFEDLTVWVPPNIDDFLERNYDIRQCLAPYYNHRYEKEIPDERQIVRPCVQLTSLYSFTNIEDEYYDSS